MSLTNILQRLLPKKIELVIAFALFSLFFGAGNLILPPMLGFWAGNDWFLVALGFCLSAVLIPILGIMAHARLQGTLFDFAKKISPTFSLVFCTLIYLISVALPAPRTASVTHEIAIAPLFQTSSWLTSVLYFTLVLFFVLNRSKILDLIGKYLTPAILLVLLTIIGIALFDLNLPTQNNVLTNVFGTGILEGYQTFDAIGAVVVGGVIIISINIKYDQLPYKEKRGLIAKGGLLAGLALFLIYIGLIVTGALHQNSFAEDISRTDLLVGISENTLGKSATLFLSLLVGLACFTTAVGIVTGASDFIKGQYKNSQRAYIITAIVSCVLGVLMGQFNVGYIIAVAIPILMLAYPLTIVLILLNILPEKYAGKKVFLFTAITTLLFSLPEFLFYVLGPLDIGFNSVQKILSWVPLNEHHLAWVLPAVLAFFLSNFIFKERSE